jgi:Ni,Fe-hydrogenase I large subunit
MSINTTIEDLEVKTKMTERAVKTCHKETGVPISELASLLVRMTKEVKEITELLEKNSEEMQDFFKKN